MTTELTAVSVRICYDCNDRPSRTQGLCHTCYERMRNRAIIAGEWESVLVPKDRTVAHIEALREKGYSLILIAKLANVEQRTVGRAVRNETQEIELETEERVLSVPVVSLWELWKTTEHGHRMPSGPAVRRLRALATEGWMYQTIGEKLGWETTQVARLALRPSKTVFASTTRAVDKIYRDPDFLTPRRAARRDILLHKWPNSFEWDDIDDPDETRFAYYRAATRVARMIERGEL